MGVRIRLECAMRRLVLSRGLSASARVAHRTKCLRVCAHGCGREVGAVHEPRSGASRWQHTTSILTRRAEAPTRGTLAIVPMAGATAGAARIHALYLCTSTQQQNQRTTATRSCRVGAAQGQAGGTRRRRRRGCTGRHHFALGWCVRATVGSAGGYSNEKNPIVKTARHEGAP